MAWQREEIVQVAARDLTAYAWSHLRAYHDVSYVKDLIVSQHQVEAKHHHFAAKQAAQIRFCLTQASEYFDAAKVVSSATKPLLLYYAIMSLALAEVLFKSDGTLSLDGARVRHKHHGLKLEGEPVFGAGMKLETAARAVGATTLADGDGGERGTFGLWRRVARASSLVAKSRHSKNGIVTDSYNAVYSFEGFPPSSTLGSLTLFDCLSMIPGMLDSEFARPFSQVIRGSLERASHTTWTARSSRKEQLDDFVRSFQFDPSAVNLDDKSGLTEFHEGVQINIEPMLGRQMRRFPQGSMWTTDEIRFWPSWVPLNEFGYIYFGLYIVGNYARYFPDIWMQHLEASSPLAVAVGQMMDVAQQRMALLTLNALTHKQHLPAS
jgi:hypothetical protein